MDELRTYRQALSNIAAKLKSANIHSPDSQAQHFLSEYLEISWGTLMAQTDKLMANELWDNFQPLLERRLLGEPQAYILGHKEFYGLKFLVDHRVLIPRSETEILVEKALEKLPINKNLQVADLGCGSGCIGMAIAKHRPNAKVVLVDSSAEAVLVAQKNNQNLGLIDQVEVLNESISDDITDWGHRKDHFHLIVANPPYIQHGDQRVSNEVHKFEPHQALYANQEGREWIHKWLAWGYHCLQVGGYMLIEVGASQATEVIRNHHSSGLKYIEVFKDYQQIDRIMVFQKG